MPFVSGKAGLPRDPEGRGRQRHVRQTPARLSCPLMDGLAREPAIHYVLALQEAVAIAMADGYRAGEPALSARRQRAYRPRPRQRDGDALRRLEVGRPPCS